jgi:hypothetical protein
MPMFAPIPLFKDFRNDTPGAHRAASVVQMPVCAALSDRQVTRIARQAQRMLSRGSSPALPVPKASPQ